MRVRDRGFALMLVLIASAGAFALAVQAGLSARASLMETRAMIDRADSARKARGAVVIALSGLLTPAQGFDEGALDSEGAGSVASRAGGASGAGDNEPDPSEIELPPIVRELLAGMLEQAELEQDEREENRQNIARLNAGASADAGSSIPSAFGSRLLERFGLPTEVSLSLPDDETSYTIRFSDAIGLLNINLAEERQLVTYLRLKGLETDRATAIAHQILDWRDEDDFVRPLGAEADNYAGTGIEIANERFVTLEQLLYLPSMTRDIYAMIRADLSLAGNDVHANSAPYEVLASVPGMPAGFAPRILAAREAGPLDEEALRALAPPGADEALARLRTTPSNLVRLRVETRGVGRRVYEGHAAIDQRGIRAIALAPVYDFPEDPA